MLSVDDPALLTVIAREAVARVSTCRPFDLASLAWSFAKLLKRDPTLLDALVSESCAKVQLFYPQDLSNMGWAVATLRIHDKRLMAAIAEAAKTKLADFGPQDLANLAWAYATLESRDYELINAMVKASAQRLSGFTAQGLCNMLWAVAVLACDDVVFLDVMSAALQKRRDELLPQALANISWACAIVRYKDEALLTTVADLAEDKINTFVPLQLGNMAWSFAQLDFLDSPFIAALAKWLCTSCQNISLTSEGSGIIGSMGEGPLYLFNLLQFSAALAPLVEGVPGERQETASSALAAVLKVLQQRAEMLDSPALMEMQREAQAVGGDQMPSILVQAGGLRVLDKPPGWEIQSYFNDETDIDPTGLLPEGSSTVTRETGSRKGQLTSWLVEQFGSQSPIALDADAQHGLVHRLDRETSGVLLWAGSYQAYYQARFIFSIRRVKKIYACLCLGWLDRELGFIETSLRSMAASSEGPPRTVVDPFGRPAKTEIEDVGHYVNKDGMKLSLVKVRLHTGRQHQIRIHLSSSGHPLLGDLLYGGEKPLWCPRICLHAARLELTGLDGVPVVQATSLFPADLANVAAELKDQNGQPATVQLKHWGLTNSA